MKITKVILSGESNNYYKIHLCNEHEKWSSIRLKTKTNIYIDFEINYGEIAYLLQLPGQELMSPFEAYNKLKKCTYDNKFFNKPRAEVYDKMLQLLLENCLHEKLDVLLKNI